MRCLAFLSLLAAAASNLVGIDWGHDTLKVALIKPGKLTQIVTNVESKRKTPNFVAFYGEERLFGGHADAKRGTKPAHVVPEPNKLLGRPPAHPFSRQYANGSNYVTGTEPNARGGVDVLLPAGALTAAAGEPRFSTEEVAAQMLTHVREFSEAFAETGKVNQAVLTVPMYYTQAERAALLDVAGLAGFNVMALVEENTAAGVHYGVDRVTPLGTQHYMLLYNMGAQATQVTLFAYDSYNHTDKMSRKNVTVGQGRVVAKAYDLGLGGRHFDAVLVDHVARAFNADAKVAKKLDAAAGGDLRAVPLAMVKVAKAVVKAKEVLSANEAFPVNLEGVLPDVDFKVNLNRKILDEAAGAAGLWTRVTAIVDKVLGAAGLAPGDVHAVELVGGSVRIPKVQALLKEHFAPKTKEAVAAAAAAAKAAAAAGNETSVTVGTHMNGDESFALGAVFVAANRSTSVRVRKVGMVDANTFAVGLRLAHLPGNASAAAGDAAAAAPAPTKPWSKRSANLFGLYNSGEDSKKRISFHSTRDVLATLYYENVTDPLAPALPPGTSDILGRYHITGIEELMGNATVAARGNPKIHLVFSHDLLGQMVLIKAEATQEEEVLVPEPVAPVPKAKNGTAAAGKNGTAAGVNASSSNSTGEEEAAAAGGADANATNSTPAPKMKLVKNTLRFPLTFTLNVTGAYPVKPLSEAEKQTVLARFATLKAEDDKKRMVETAKSECEATMYKFRDDLEGQEEELKKVTTAEQREGMSGAISELQLWLEEDGVSATYDEYKAKTADFRAKMMPAFSRSTELGWREKALKSAREEISKWRETVGKWNDTHPQVRF